MKEKFKIVAVFFSLVFWFHQGLKKNFHSLLLIIFYFLLQQFPSPVDIATLDFVCNK